MTPKEYIDEHFSNLLEQLEEQTPDRVIYARTNNLIRRYREGQMQFEHSSSWPRQLANIMAGPDPLETVLEASATLTQTATPGWQLHGRSPARDRLRLDADAYSYLTFCPDILHEEPMIVHWWNADLDRLTEALHKGHPLWTPILRENMVADIQGQEMEGKTLKQIYVEQAPIFNIRSSSYSGILNDQMRFIVQLRNSLVFEFEETTSLLRISLTAPINRGTDLFGYTNEDLHLLSDTPQILKEILEGSINTSHADLVESVMTYELLGHSTLSPMERWPHVSSGFAPPPEATPHQLNGWRTNILNPWLNSPFMNDGNFTYLKENILKTLRLTTIAATTFTHEMNLYVMKETASNYEALTARANQEAVKTAFEQLAEDSFNRGNTVIPHSNANWTYTYIGDRSFHRPGISYGDLREATMLVHWNNLKWGTPDRHLTPAGIPFWHDLPQIILTEDSGSVVSCTECGEYRLLNDATWSNRYDAWYCQSCYEAYYEDDEYDEYDEYDDPGSPFIRNYSFTPDPLLFVFPSGKKSITPLKEELDSASYWTWWQNATQKERQARSPLFMGMELEVEVDGSRNTIAEVFLNQPDLDNLFYLKEDSSIRNGFEIVTHPFSPEWGLENFPFKAFERMITDDYFIPESSNCGQHIHVSRSAFSKAHMMKFLWFHEQHEQLITQVGGRPSVNYADWDSYKRSVENRKGFLVKSGETTTRSAVHLGVETIELRYPAGNVTPDNIRKNIEWIDAIFKFTKMLSVKDIKNISDPGYLLFFVTAHKDKYPQLYKTLMQHYPVPKPIESMRSN